MKQLTDNDLIALLNDIESDRVERKESFNGDVPKKAQQAVCGPRRAIANEQEERVLSEKRRYKNLPFDLHPVPIAKLSDLSRPLFETE